MVTINCSKVIIDSDPGIDDALAILYVLSNKKIETLGISTVMGNADIESVTKNANFIANWIRDVPIWKGSQKPLTRDFKKGNVMGSTGLGKIRPPKLKYVPKNAINEIVNILEKNKKQIDILAIGPLTNLAKIFKQNPSLTKKVRQLTILGGSATGIGNMNRVSEFNFFIDPEAASIILQLPIQKVLIPLELCYQTTLELNDFKILSKKPYYFKLMDILNKYKKNLSIYEGQNSIVVYDALAAFVMLNPKDCKTELIDAVIETKGEYTNGMMVVDKRNYGNKKYNIKLVTYIDKAKFKKNFFTSLLNYEI